MKKLIHLVAAARPNFMKIAPLYHRLKGEAWAEPVIVHTGQHYDFNMSDAFFQNLNLPDPAIHLSVGSGTHAQQTGNVMIAYEKILMGASSEGGHTSRQWSSEECPSNLCRPDLAVVVGDVNSTAAVTLACAKLGVKTAHLEAGLRSFDRTMPEEINRIVTDALADLLWTPSPDADANLLREGVSAEKIERVGNIMIDSLEMMRKSIEKERYYESLGFTPAGYAVVTLHRPSNVDSPEALEKLVRHLVRAAQQLPLVFPLHPRTRKNLAALGLLDDLEKTPAIRLVEPLPYIAFMNLVFNCKMVVTDSGGVQEETTYLGIPCITLRPNTERPITVTEGTNRLCEIDEMDERIDDVLAAPPRSRTIPALWDGKTADRVAASMKRFLF